MRARREMHGLSWVNGKRTPLHILWLAIRNRCNNPKTPDYKYYGGRGIYVCDRWSQFRKFVEDVGPHPGRGWTLDRIDNNWHYEPGNVRWATRQVQARNRNYCVLTKVEADYIRQLYGNGKRGWRQIDLARKFGVTQAHISAVIRGVVWA
jgi:hypothetical protein